MGAGKKIGSAFLFAVALEAGERIGKAIGRRLARWIDGPPLAKKKKRKKRKKCRK